MRLFSNSMKETPVCEGEVGIICSMEDKLLYRDEVYAIQGALFDVYKTMGNMWGEEVYQLLV